MSDTAHIQAVTLDKFLTAWKDQAVEDTIALWSDDFKQQLLPSSLGVPSHSRAESEKIYPKLTGSLRNWKLDIKEVVHDVGRGTAAVYATSQADTPLPNEKWTTDFSIFLSFTEDGLRVNRLDEMVDSGFYADYFPKFQQWLRENMSPKEESH
ncbi:uncharacterized protein N7479_010736 [Penicillium vulpinum]|uniref:SnoaL-like domain-containing protein n=1 Tax=Penicillium vulpinum TaxID=29845 RepID=A0A1V6S9A2_9EURO|nr:uncharacterized protein N7479_010736 [Penicillium vulpinum]KAJ5952323.1 hypothetical protein N7479_010736 [Penicillium vulpinum]OQE10319.1 hypothetical protein PENVUL_c004G01776 [Penicillium vulpinum]